MKCFELGEFPLIARLAQTVLRHSSVIVGIGDDAAVLCSNDPSRYLLFKTDPVIEKTHFLFRSSKPTAQPAASPYHVGWKAMARNFSDIAAMGGVPRWALVSLGLPRATDVKIVDGIYCGLNACASQFGAVIVGGDTAQTHGPLFLSVSVIGDVEKQNLKLRSAARDGQMVFVTGTLGGARLGKHLKFTPRIEEARWLVQAVPVQAMMDLSDGLGSDLRRLAESSGVGFDIIANAIPIANAARRLARKDRKSPLEHAWSDGEDFELLFTIEAKHADNLLRRWYRKFDLPLTPIGVVTSSRNKIRLLSRDKKTRIAQKKGFEHFQ